MRSVSATGSASEFFGSVKALLFWLEFDGLYFGKLLFLNKGNSFYVVVSENKIKASISIVL